MTVENVNTPPRVTETDPRTTLTKVPEDVLAIENEVKKQRARRELVQETKLTEDLQKPQAPPEPPFKIGGSINLGNIDFQEQQRIAREETEKARVQSQSTIERLTRERDDAKNALQATELRHVQDTLLSQIDLLKDAISKGQNQDFGAQLAAIEGMAGKLGYSRVTGDGGAWDQQLALKKLEIEFKREDRRFALEMKRDERAWQMEMKKLDQQARESQERLDQEKQKFQALASLPEQIGGAIAKGLIARGEGPDTGIGTSPQSPAPIPVQAGEGEAGEFNCPRCKSVVGLGPTSKKSICVGCHQEFDIQRTTVSEPQGEVQRTGHIV